MTGEFRDRMVGLTVREAEQSPEIDTRAGLVEAHDTFNIIARNRTDDPQVGAGSAEFFALWQKPR
jgi:hypothetical protein